MVPPDQASVPDEEYLHYRVFLLRCQGNDIPVAHVAAGNLLLLGDLAYAVQKFPVLDGLFEFQIFRCPLHLFFQFSQHRRVISVQERQRLLHRFSVGFFGNISLAGRRALMNMVVQAGAVLSDHFGQRPVAGTDPVQLVDQLDGILHRSRAGVRSKVFCMVLVHPARKEHPWIFLLHRYLDKRIGLVIHEHGIVLRSVLLDEVALQYQCFQFRICDDIFKSGDVGHHLVDLDAPVPAGLEILAHTVFQGNSFSHIDNRVLLVMHQIDARLRRKLFQFLLYIKRHFFLLFPKRHTCRAALPFKKRGLLQAPFSSYSANINSS